MDDPQLQAVNVNEGFLRKFDKAFAEHYGADSYFVLTLSDYFTSALARLLESKNMLKSWDSVALYSSDNAVRKLSEYFRNVEGARESALRECFGAAPVGSTEELIDKTLGPGSFSRMCRELENVKR